MDSPSLFDIQVYSSEAILYNWGDKNRMLHFDIANIVHKAKVRKEELGILLKNIFHLKIYMFLTLCKV